MNKVFTKGSLNAALSAILVMLILLCSASAEVFDSEKSLADYSDEELRSVLSEYDAASIAIYSELGRRIREEKTTVEEKHLGTIEQLFPDEVVACYVREQLNKLSIKQPVTQEELDTITEFFMWNKYGKEYYDVTGIGYLRNLTKVVLSSQGYATADYLGEALSDDLFTLTKLQHLEISYYSTNRPLPLKTISDKIGNLTELTCLDLANTQIATLPESIGKLQKLKELDISGTKVSELPDSIWTLPLEKVNMAGTGVK